MLEVTVTVPFHASDTDFAARLGLFPGRGTEGAVPGVDGDSRPSPRDSARSAGHYRRHALPQVLHQAPLRRRRSAPGSLSTRVSVSLSHSPAAAAYGGFAAVGPAGTGDVDRLLHVAAARRTAANAGSAAFTADVGRLVCTKSATTFPGFSRLIDAVVGTRLKKYQYRLQQTEV